MTIDEIGFSFRELGFRRWWLVVVGVFLFLLHSVSRIWLPRCKSFIEKVYELANKSLMEDS